MSVKDVSTESEFKKLTDNGLAIVKYSAEWCGPCKRIHPQYKELAKQNNDVNFLHVDIDSTTESMPNQVSDIFSVPTFHFYKDGKVVDKLEGANVNMLKAKLEKLKEKKTEKKESNSEAKSSGESGEVREVTTAKEYNEIIATGKTIVDFSAVWWCG
jgi:thiol-disulfide isomerase/thioredoxin